MFINYLRHHFSVCVVYIKTNNNYQYHCWIHIINIRCINMRYHTSTQVTQMYQHAISHVHTRNTDVSTCVITRPHRQHRCITMRYHTSTQATQMYYHALILTLQRILSCISHLFSGSAEVQFRLSAVYHERDRLYLLTLRHAGHLACNYSLIKH